MQRSDTIAELARALAKAQAAAKPAIKDAANPAYKGARYADMSSVLDACEDALTANGLAIVQAPICTADGAGVETLIAHTSGEWISETLLLPVGGKKDAQAVGSCITYARRYSLEGFLRIRREDDDGNAACATPAPAPAQLAPKKQGSEKDQIQQNAYEVRQWTDWLAGRPDLAGVNETLAENMAQVSQPVKRQVWLLIAGYAKEQGWEFAKESKTFCIRKDSEE